MPKQLRRAGQNIRELALKRRIKGVCSFVGSGLVIFMPILLFKVFNDFMKQIASNNSSQSQASLNMPPMLYLVTIIAALGLVVNGISLWKRADRADQGAKGEEDISKELAQLENDGWEIEYGMRLGNRLGDADIVCISPQGKAYVIDVKSHKGEVIVEGEKLNRRMGKANYPFEKDFIKQVMKQALEVKKQKSLKFVTPILAFSEAKVFVPSNKLRNVYVVEKSSLISLLKTLG
ncbi:MAG: nuclease [Pseudanabaena sp.]|nr:MAG: nuclease [Pseudanabaena sp.]